jgi:hypothetical protein
MKEYTVYARRSQLLEVRVDANSKAEALEKAKAGEGMYGEYVSQSMERYYPTVKEAIKGRKKELAYSE